MKLVMNLTIANTQLSVGDIKALLQDKGTVTVTYHAEIDEVPSSSLPEGREVCLYVPAALEDGYVLVANNGETEGTSVSLEEATEMQATGVCRELYARYPRADRYGAPMYATDTDISFGQAVVAEQGFKVSDNLEVSAQDSGDDTPEEYWLTIALPA